MAPVLKGTWEESGRREVTYPEGCLPNLQHLRQHSFVGAQSPRRPALDISPKAIL